MKIRAAMLAALLGLGAGTAQAQVRWGDAPGYYEGVSARTIVRSVRARGLIPVSRVMRRGDLYYVNATDDYGRIRRVTLDAYSGRIVRIEGAARAERGPGLPPLTRARPRYDDEPRFEARRPSREVGEMPPRVIPADPEVAERRLPPLRPRAGLPPDRDFGPRALPPPPNTWAGRSVEENPPRPSAGVPRRDRTRAAAVSPKHAPTPRPRPAGAGEVPAPQASEEAKPDAAAPREAAVPPASATDVAPEPVQKAPEPAAEPAPKAPETGAEPAAGESAAAPEKPASAPRVILPGPVPKAERTPETQSGRRAASNDAQAQAPSASEPAARAPEAGPQAESPKSESPQAASPDEKPAAGAMPPVQGLE